MKNALMRITGLHEDKVFLENFKGDWNRFCNTYSPRKRTSSWEDVKNENHDFIPLKIKLDEQFGHFYEIYLKHKVLPDIKFINNLDSSYWDTLKDMHAILGENPYPQERENSIDKAYDVRYKGIILINYLLELSESLPRFLYYSAVKHAIYLAIPFGLILVIVSIIKSIIFLFK